MKSTPHKIAVRPPTSHLTKHPRYTNKTCETLLEKQRRTLKQQSLMDFFIWTHQWRLTIKTCLHPLCAYTRCRLECLPIAKVIRMDGERNSRKSVHSAWLDDGNDDENADEIYFLTKTNNAPLNLNSFLKFIRFKEVFKRNWYLLHSLKVLRVDSEFLSPWFRQSTKPDHFGLSI